MRKAIRVWRIEGFKSLLDKSWAKLILLLRQNAIRTETHRQPTQESLSERILLICDHPDLSVESELYGDVNLHGWALASSGIEKVEIYLGNEVLGEASYGHLRPDVGNDHPEFDEPERSGYRMVWDSREWRDGSYNISVRAISPAGSKLDIIGKVHINNLTPRKKPYEKWIENVEAKDIKEAMQEAQCLDHMPLISVIMPVHNTDPALLEQAAGSLANQIYDRWELCVCDDGSTNTETLKTIRRLSQEDPRIRLVELEENLGISAASNQALTLAQGEHIALMDHDDELPSHALYFIAKFLNDHPDTDFIYSDEDKIDLGGERYDPFFKPDWSPDLFLSSNYLNHLTVIRKNLIDKVGGFQSEYDGSQDYDLYLRCIENTERIGHVPKVLYHWRATPSSTASDSRIGMKAHEAAQRALQDHLSRRDVQAEVVQGNSLVRWRIQYEIKQEPGVSIIIPTGGRISLLETCIQSVLERTDYSSFEIIIVDNSKDVKVQGFHKTLFDISDKNKIPIHYIDYRNMPFNFSIINNYAVAETQNPLVLFLNDDIQPINSEWLRAMVEHAQRPEVGAVGAKLVYPDDTIQHAGVIMGVYDNSGHAFKYMPADEAEHYQFDQAHIVRNYSAVTAACLMTRRDVFWDANGFEEIHLPVAFQDVDFCLKLRKLDYRIVYTPYAKLYHDEAKTKSEKIPNPYEVRYMKRKWHDVIANDPYYNPNLTRSNEDFSIGSG